MVLHQVETKVWMILVLWTYFKGWYHLLCPIQLMIILTKGIQSTTWIIHCNLDIELFSSCLCFRPWTCMHDGWCIACVFAAGTKWMSSGSGGCRSSRVPQSSRRQGRAREELEPRIRCWETESVQGWKPGLVREGTKMSYYRIKIFLVKKINKSMWPGEHT